MPLKALPPGYFAAIASVAVLAAAAAGAADPAPPAPVALSEGAAQGPPCESQPYSILVWVKNIKDDRGTITIDLHGDDPEKFLKSGAKLARLRFPTRAGDMKICVPVEKPGVYAIALYQDRDSNLKLDKTWIGLPSEPFGVSRDAPLRMAPPKHKEAAFEVAGPLTPVTVTLRK
jgi:uncharacterized protein (DUF2141 family)